MVCENNILVFLQHKTNGRDWLSIKECGTCQAKRFPFISISKSAIIRDIIVFSLERKDHHEQYYSETHLWDRNQL